MTVLGTQMVLINLGKKRYMKYVLVVLVVLLNQFYRDNLAKRYMENSRKPSAHYVHFASQLYLHVTTLLPVVSMDTRLSQLFQGKWIT